MSKELQDEELEVLKSIYEGDENFKATSKNVPTFQYKVGNDGESKSFLLEIAWEGDYPDIKPMINLESFYNKHLLQEVKDSIISRLNEEAEQYLGMAMTYSLIEWAKENTTDLLSKQPEGPSQMEVSSSVDNVEVDLEDLSLSTSITKKKVQLTKQQKRKLYDQLNVRGERPRGWDWVDVIKHLSQSGGKENSPIPSSET